MPKYRFEWINLPRGLLHQLAYELKLPGDPAAALRKAYGARPDENFVRDAWPVLLEHWVIKSPALRRSLAMGLQARGLGDLEAKLTSARAETIYLHSCRNSPRLRSLVLDHFITAGEEPPAPKSAATGNRLVSTRRPRSSADWRDFRESLAAALSKFEVNQYLILSLRHHPNYYIQIAHGGPDGVHAEVVSNEFLSDDEKLDTEALSTLGALGWEPPDPKEQARGCPNFYRNWHAPVSYPDVSFLVERTLTEVFGVANPRMLLYKAFARGGTEIILPTLAVRREPINKQQIKPTEHEAPASPEELFEQVKEVMKKVLGTQEIVTDEDGDIPVHYDNVMVYLRVMKDQPLVRIFSPVIFDIGNPPDILETVNQMNSEILYAKAIWTGEAVLLTTDVLGMPLESAQLLRGYVAVAQLANDYATKLQQRYGGRITFGPALPPKVQPIGGYL